MVVETQAVPQLFLRTAFNQLCFLQYEQSTEQTFKLPPEEWKEVNYADLWLLTFTCTCDINVTQDLHLENLYPFTLVFM